MIESRFRAGLLTVVILGLFAGCGGGEQESPADPLAVWFSTPEKVVQGLMFAYETRNDSLYAELLADEFRYSFEPPGADSADVLGWGKEEDLVATGNLFRTPDVNVLALELQIEAAVTVSDRPEWMMVPVSGGELRVEVNEREPMQVELNRQEIFVRPVPGTKDRWQVIAWRDYPEPITP